MPRVIGTIVFGSDSRPFAGATVYVRLEDVSRVDVSARIVAEAVLQEARADGQASDRIEFAMDAPTLNARARYVARVHVDVDADGQVSIGDYVSTMSHPVEVGSDTVTLSIPVKRVS